MSIAQLKVEIVEQVSKLESEKALLEIKNLLETIENTDKKPKSLKEPLQAEEIFVEVVQQYGSVLEKLAQ